MTRKYLLPSLIIATMISGLPMHLAHAAGGKKDKGGDKGGDQGGEAEMNFEEGETVGKSGPPSKTLERAIKLYDKGDYYSASIEFYKVIKGESQDSDANREKAEYYMGKTLYQMKFYAASAAYFDKIVEKGAAHRYHGVTLKWLAALAKVLPESAGILQKIGKYSRDDLEDKALDSVRPELYYYLGRQYYLEGKLEQAIELFQAIPQDSEWYIPGKFMEGVSWVLVPKGQEAIDAFKEILVINSEPALRKKYKKDQVREYSELAYLSMARVFYSTGQNETAIKYYEKIPQDSPYWLDSLFEASWGYFRLKRNSKALGNIHTLTAPYFENEFYPEGVVVKAVIYFNYCRYDRALEAVAEYQNLYPPMRDELRKVVKMNEDDNAEFYKYAKKIREGTSGLPDRVQRLAQTSLQSKDLLKTWQWVDELDREIAQYEKSDKAWKTTAIAGEVLQELTVQKSLAEAEAGRVARDKLKRLVQELNDLGNDARSVKIAVLEAKVGQKRAEFLKEQIYADNRAEPITVDDEHFTWGFNGEWWKDELGFYRFRISSRCVKQQ
jgi:tetratricopeptide (TPR) repeat protein